MAHSEETHVCYRCIGDAFLRKELRAKGSRRRCSYCEKLGRGKSLAELAERIEEVLDGFFELTDIEPSGIDYALSRDRGWWERPGDPVDIVIANITEVDEEIAKDIQSHLSNLHFDFDRAKSGEEDPYGDEACYQERGPDVWGFHETWSWFRTNLRSRARFFSRNAEQALSEIFHDLDDLQTYAGKSVIRTIQPGGEKQFLFRARVAQSVKELQAILRSPTRELGPPPSSRARSGRMNASGIPVFYGGLDEETCVAEIRPPVGSHVVVGRFEVIRPHGLLDFEVLNQVYVPGSYFDPHLQTLQGRAAFLRHLVQEISQPIMPIDEEFEYLPTQAVAEYLAERVEPRLDGIIFPSSQTDGNGRNIVLFHQASGVEPYEIPEGTEVSFNMGWQTEDDFNDEITIWEKVPGKPKKKQSPSRSGRFPFGIPNVMDSEPGANDDDDYLAPRDPTLRLDVNGLRVLVVKGVNYSSSPRSIYRHRESKDEPEEF